MNFLIPSIRSVTRFFAQLILVVAASFCVNVQAADSFVIKDIRIEGLQRVEPGTVFSYLPVQVGDTFTDEKSAEAIKALYSTGFFRDVQIQAQGSVLIVIVEERPTISRIEFTGMKEFDQEVVRKSLKAVGVAEARFYDKALIDKAEQELKRQYVGKGMYAAEVVATVTPVERNQVAIYFNIDEGPVAKIQEINFIGNNVFSESTLKSQMQLKTGGWLSWYSKDNLYSKQKLTADLENIRSYYLNRGYLEFVIESTQVSITPDKKGIYLTVSIREGNKFTVKNVRLAGDLLGKEAELIQLVSLKAGDTFSSAKLTESTKAIAEGKPLPELISGSEQDQLLKEVLTEIDSSLWPKHLDSTVRSLTGFRTELRDLIAACLEHGVSPDQLTELGKSQGLTEWIAAATCYASYLEKLEQSDRARYDSASFL
ncbi:MAG: hypothetical protein RLY75_791 [Pseudomonadota bacterium]